MIASNFEGVDLTTPIVVAALIASMMLAGMARALRDAGRRRRPRAVTTWQRASSAALRQVGEVGMAVAVVILIAGSWVGIQQKSIDQVNREEATQSCIKEYPRFVEWERSGNALENWWTGDPIPGHAATRKATKKQFIDRCVRMTVD